ncbi:MAG: anti-sigma F factor [Clostridia bacterium]|nr:anti-sigma F factor [Clostridia bacterium]
MKTAFLAIPENEAFSRSVISSFAMQLDPDVEQLADVRLAVSEAVTNCIVHAYKASAVPGVVTVAAKCYEGGMLKITVSDSGCGIEDVEAAKKPLFTTSPETERSGMGFAIMESSCDRVAVRSSPGKGTKVTLYKVIG